MTSGFIAALLVMIVMTIYVFVILHILAVNTGTKIRDNVIAQIQTYDTLLEKKEDELQRLRQQIEQEQMNLIGNNKSKTSNEKEAFDVYVTNNVDYCKTDFSSDYRLLKESFDFNRTELITSIWKEQEWESLDRRNQVLDNLIEILTFENAYKLSLLNSSEQLEVLRELLSGSELSLLEEYIDGNKTFQSRNFYQWLHVQKRFADQRVYIKTGIKNETFDGLNKNISTEYDENLCEGFQLLIGTRLYDYGVHRHELIS